MLHVFLSDVNRNGKWDGRVLEHEPRENIQKGKGQANPLTHGLTMFW